MAKGKRGKRDARARWIEQDARRDDGGEDNTEDKQATRRLGKTKARDENETPSDENGRTATKGNEAVLLF